MGGRGSRREGLRLPLSRYSPTVVPLNGMNGAIWGNTQVNSTATTASVSSTAWTTFSAFGPGNTRQSNL